MGFLFKNKRWVMSGGTADIDLLALAKPRTRAFYVYDLSEALLRADRFLNSGMSVHYAMKANSCPRVLREFAKRGLGADVVSLGELQKALACGFAPGRVIFSGVAKDHEELEFAVQQKIHQINVESFEELKLLAAICAEKATVAPAGLRLNIRMKAPTHAHVQTANPESKFGIDMDQLPEILLWARANPSVQIKGIATHIGSQIEDLSVFESMARTMGEIYRDLRGHGLALERLDLGGGLGIDYRSSGHEDLGRAEEYLRMIKGAHGTDAAVSLEPGRFLVARMGALLAKVIYVKKTSAANFAILNAGMNALMRPALYESFHRIDALLDRGEKDRYTVVGPICESTDKFAQDREMSRLERGDWVAIFDTGAYGATMANTYNEHPLPEQWSYLNGTWEVS